MTYEVPSLLYLSKFATLASVILELKLPERWKDISLKHTQTWRRYERTFQSKFAEPIRTFFKHWMRTIFSVKYDVKMNGDAECALLRECRKCEFLRSFRSLDNSGVRNAVKNSPDAWRNSFFWSTASKKWENFGLYASHFKDCRYKE